MTILRDVSIMWSMFHILVLFCMLYESRFSKKTTIIATIIAVIVWLGGQGLILYMFGPVVMSQIIIFTGTLPSLLFFWIMSKQRDGRFLFTFCLCDTISAEILLITNLLDHYLFGNMYIGMFIIRLIAFPVLEFFAYKYIRPVFSEVQRSVRKGWWTFASVAAIFYVMIIVLSSVPYDKTHLPDQLPAFVLICVLMPLMYWNIFQVLLHQQKIFDMAQKDNLLKLQVVNMQMRIEQFSKADEKFRIERHDMRHKLRAITEMIQGGRLDDLKEYVLSAEQKLEDSSMEHYCTNPILDAVLTAYFKNAEEKGIDIKCDLAVPFDMEVDTAELSVVFANAIENAIHACEKLPNEQRFIEVRALSHPKFMFQISNPYVGEVKTDDKGIPISTESGHGFGTRSIVAFCDKYDAYYDFRAEDGIFTLRIVMN